MTWFIELQNRFNESRLFKILMIYVLNQIDDLTSWHLTTLMTRNLIFALKMIWIEWWFEFVNLLLYWSHWFRWICWCVTLWVKILWQWWHWTVASLSDMIIDWKLLMTSWFKDLSSCCKDIAEGSRKIEICNCKQIS